MKPTLYCLLALLFFIFGCNPTEPTKKAPIVDPYESALPHGESLPREQYSAQDQKKIREGFGKEADSLSIVDLKGMLDSLGGHLHVINFWSVNCTSCNENNKNLELAQSMLGDTNIIIKHVNIDDQEMLGEVNTSIRVQGLVNPCYNLSSGSQYNWPSMVQANWDGSLPAFVLLNKEEGIYLFYQKAFEKEEITALLQPFSF